MARVLGTDGRDTLTAGSRGDKLLGRDGKDLLQGGFGSDTLNGGRGDDRLIDNIFGGQKDNQVDVLFGGAGNDTIISFGGADQINGAGGRDVIVAHGDGARILGGGGRDHITATGDNVTIDGGKGIDFASVRIDDATDDLVLDLISGEETVFENGTVVTNVEAFGVFTGSGNDLIDLTEFDDEANGGAGNDEILGRGGNDELSGAAGDDVLDGGAGDDVLDGGAGADVLLGGAGNDELVLSGADTVFGGDGADDFVVDFHVRDGDGVAVIKDFSIEEGDQLDFFGIVNQVAEAGGVIGRDGSGVIVFEDTDEGTLVSINSFGGQPTSSPTGELVASVFIEGVAAEDLQSADVLVFDNNFDFF